MLPNCPQYIIAAFAILRLGAVVVNINPSYTAREVLDRRRRLGRRGSLITLDALAPLVAGIRGADRASSRSSSPRWPNTRAAAAPPPRIDGTLRARRPDRRR